MSFQESRWCDRCREDNRARGRFCAGCGCLLQGHSQSTGLADRLRAIDFRLDAMDASFQCKDYERKKSSLQGKLESFLQDLGKTIFTARPRDVRRFLVSRECAGRTKIHDVKCPCLGQRHTNCECPYSMALGTIESLVGQLRSIFGRAGRGAVWNDVTGEGNPAAAQEIKHHLTCVSEERARAHVLPKQARPLFMDKLRSVNMYVGDELASGCLSCVDRFLFLRDRAFFTLQFFAGDRTGDLGLMLIQEIRVLPRNTGYVLVHTWGKTLRGDRSARIFLLRGSDQVVCPVAHLDEYVSGARIMGVDMSTGYLFRPVTSQGFVLESPLPYADVYARLRLYLNRLGLFQGETPHGIRGGAAITLLLTGSANSTSEIMACGGWRTSAMAEQYSRMGDINERNAIATRLSKASHQDAGLADNVSVQFAECDLERFPQAF